MATERADSKGLQVFDGFTSSAAVTKSDSTALKFDALWVGGTGNVVIKHTEPGDAVTFTNVANGVLLPVAGVRVMAATSATNIVALRR